MVDFKKLQEKKGKPKPLNPRDIFNALPKPPGINDLYASQAEVLDAWFARRTDRDVVVKLHTGGGKTLVALLMAQSVMNELGEPVIYLAPTNQLVDQVIGKEPRIRHPDRPLREGAAAGGASSSTARPSSSAPTRPCSTAAASSASAIQGRTSSRSAPSSSTMRMSHSRRCAKRSA